MGSLRYMGVRAKNPPDFKIRDRAPLAEDIEGLYKGDFWLRDLTNELWMLTDKANNIATWTKLTAGGSQIFTEITITPGDLTITNLSSGTLRSSVAGLISSFPDGSDLDVYMGRTGNTAVWGKLESLTGSITITKTLTGINLESGGAVAAGFFTTDEGFPVPPSAGGNLFTEGGTNITSVGDIPGNKITFNLNDNVTIAGTLTANSITIATDLDVPQGGTGVGTLLEHGILVGDGVNPVNVLAEGQTGSFLVGNTGADPSWSDSSFPDSSTQGDILYAQADNDIVMLPKDVNATRYLSNTGANNNPVWDQVELTNGVSGTLPITSGGLGINTVVQGDLICAIGADTIGVVTAGTAGRVLTSTGPGSVATWQNIGGKNWNVVINAAVNLVADNGYIMNRGTLITATLPAVSSVGDSFSITGIGIGGWKIEQNAGQTIYYGNQETTTGPGGYLYSEDVRDSIELVCVVANTDFNVVSGVKYQPMDVNIQAGNAYTPVLSDSGKEIQFTSATAVTLTIPTNLNVEFPIGTEIIIVQYGAGTVTVVPDGGVTLNSVSSMTDLYEQYSSVALIKQASDEFILVGDLK